MRCVGGTRLPRGRQQRQVPPPTNAVKHTLNGALGTAPPLSLGELFADPMKFLTGPVSFVSSKRGPPGAHHTTVSKDGSAPLGQHKYRTEDSSLRLLNRSLVATHV